jgi:hypothetical protein
MFGPSASEVNNAPESEVATCATYPDGQTSCNFFDPLETNQVLGGSTYTVWEDQYNTGPNAIVPAPPTSQQDFQSLVTQDMAAD